MRLRALNFPRIIAVATVCYSRLRPLSSAGEGYEDEVQWDKRGDSRGTKRAQLKVSRLQTHDSLRDP